MQKWINKINLINLYLLAARGEGELFKGKLTARTERIKGFGSLLSTANSFGAFT